MPKRQPLLIEDITAVRAQINLSEPLDAAFFACLTTTFFTAARLGEFTIKNLGSFNAETHIKTKDVQQTISNRMGNKFTPFHLRTQKWYQKKEEEKRSSGHDKRALLTQMRPSQTTWRSTNPHRQPTYSLTGTTAHTDPLPRPPFLP